jgi:hypothetical protein
MKLILNHILTDEECVEWTEIEENITWYYEVGKIMFTINNRSDGYFLICSYERAGYDEYDDLSFVQQQSDSELPTPAQTEEYMKICFDMLKNIGFYTIYRGEYEKAEWQHLCCPTCIHSKLSIDSNGFEWFYCVKEDTPVSKHSTCPDYDEACLSCKENMLRRMSKQRWIPEEKRLPIADEAVLCFIDRDNEFAIGYFDNDNKWYSCDNDNYPLDVTHWQELPRHWDTKKAR